MTLLVLGLLIFLGVHTFATMRTARAGVISKIGEGGYKAAFSVIALVGLIVIIWGYGAYRASGYTIVWDPPVWTRHLAMLLMWFAFVFITAAYTPKGKIKTALKHPMLVAIKTWALAHLLANGDLGSMILFGAFLAWAVFDRIAVKRRGGVPLDPVAGFNKGDIMALVIGTILYLAMFGAHRWLIGVPIV